MGFLKSAVQSAKFLVGVAKLAKDGGDYNTGIAPEKKPASADKPAGWSADPKAQTTPATPGTPAKGWTP